MAAIGERSGCGDVSGRHEFGEGKANERRERRKVRGIETKWLLSP